MSDTLTPAPLTAERLAEIAANHQKAVQSTGSSRPGWLNLFEAALNDRADLLAELDHLRAAMATELRGQLKDDSEFCYLSGKKMVAEMNAPIHAAAARLGLTL